MLLNVRRCLWAIGFIVLGYCGMAWFNARLHQSESSAELDRLRTTRQPDDVRTTTPPHGGLVGRMEIPRLNLSAVIFEGTDEPVLSEGVGHLTGSALPGQKGNIVLAGHRDSFFRALRNIKGGDVVDVDTEQGSRRYVVTTTRIIQPTQIEVLEPTRNPTLTLVTCYPFYYVGHAPKRFIVQGTLAEVQPDPQTEARLR
jgi:LPXTG-site transpeptidase (sortase) family protein